jgi:two-component system phosphate regulon sensor histidine kinase PhoR
MLKFGRMSSLRAESFTTSAVSGLTLLLLGMFLSLQFQRSESNYFLMVAVVAAGCLAVLMSLGRLYRRIEITDSLERRILAFGMTSRPDGLKPLLGRTALGDSWNRLVQFVHDRSIDESIERRIEQSAGSRGSERLARAVRSLSDGVAITDRQGKLSYLNPAWLGLVGQSQLEADALGKSLLLELQKIGCAGWEQISEQLLEGTKPIDVELHLGNKPADGVLRLSRVPLEGRASESEGYVWTIRDITQNALARESHEHFLAAATHELRTPITNIKAYAESLIEMEVISAEERKQFFNVIHSEADRLSRLLNQLLDIQQLEAGSMSVSLADFDVLRMMHEVQEHMAPLIREKNLKFSSRVAPDIKVIRADKEKVISCLMNLLGNAIKYTPAGGEVRLTAESLESHVAICVEDTGIGIAEDELPLIFDRFYRCQDERMIDVEGNGLGLAFAQEVARLHSGELRAESQLNQGSRFTLKLPLSQRAH